MLNEAWPLLPLSPTVIDQRTPTQGADDKERSLCLVPTLNGPAESGVSAATSCKRQETQSRNAGSLMEGTSIIKPAVFVTELRPAHGDGAVYLLSPSLRYSPFLLISTSLRLHMTPPPQN